MAKSEVSHETIDTALACMNELLNYVYDSTEEMDTAMKELEEALPEGFRCL